MESQTGPSVSLIRAFIALPVDERLMPVLTETARAVREALPASSVKWTRPENLHLTLRFLGNIPAAAVDDIAGQLRTACAGTPVLTARVAGFGCFPTSDRARVLWLGVCEPTGRLAELHARITTMLADHGQVEERARFHPHLTLGRVKELRPRERLALAEGIRACRVDDLGDWRMERVALMRSELSPDGPRYTELTSIPLVAT
jgi:2'-5' RNA ligase